MLFFIAFVKLIFQTFSVYREKFFSIGQEVEISPKKNIGKYMLIIYRLGVGIFISKKIIYFSLTLFSIISNSKINSKL